MINRDIAKMYASWFRCLADPTRLQILNILAAHREPMTVGEIVDRMGIAQSTVSAHLRRLAETCFLTVDREGTRSYFQINQSCLDAFPAASEVVMGRTPTDALPACRPGVTSRRPLTLMEAST